MNKRKQLVPTPRFLLMMTLLTMVDLHSQAEAQSEQNISSEFPTITNSLANLFMIDRPILFRGISPASLTLSQYQERGPLGAVVVAETSANLFVVLEPCDLCSVLARGDKQTGAIEILHQSHELTCSMLRQDLLKLHVQESICN